MASRPALIWRLLQVCLALILLLVLIQLTRFPVDTSQILATGWLRIGVDASYPPFAAFRDGQYEGVDIALGTALARALGVEVQFENISLDGLYDALFTRRVDVLISALVERSDLRSRVDYSLPYFNAGLILVQPTVDLSAQSLWGMAGQRIAFAFGSDAHFELNRWRRRIGPFSAQPYERPGHALDAVRLEQADAALISHADLLEYLCRYPNWEITTTEVTVVPYVIAAARENSELIERINDVLRKWLTSGALDSLIRAQFARSC